MVAKATWTVVFAIAVTLLASATVIAQSFPEEQPVLVGDHRAWLSIAKVSGALYASSAPATQSRASQLAMGPGPDPTRVYLYVSSPTHGIRRFEYAPATGLLTNRVDVIPSVRGNGIELRVNDHGQTELYASESYVSANAPSRTLSRLRRFVDADGDGAFGSVGDIDAAIAQGMLGGFHALNQIQILGDALFVGHGTRTLNGARQGVDGDLFGDSAFGGALLMIEDLDDVATADAAAGFPGYVPHPNDAQYQDLIEGAAPGAEAPYTSTAPNKLRVHSAGARNPFGVAFDQRGDVWFTTNFHRVNNFGFDRRVTGNGADVDAFDGPSNDDIHDQMFRAVAKGDYGYRNGNWQGQAATHTVGFFAGIGDPAWITPSRTFDNYDHGGIDTDPTDPAFNQFHDPALPRGLGPHSAVTGLAFAPAAFPVRYYDHAFVARWNGQFGIVDGLDYRDIVLVDAALGDVERVASGFNAPIDVVDDGYGHLLVASYYGSIWRLTPNHVLRCGFCSPRREGDERRPEAVPNIR
jgi:hypothetical protein